MSKKYIPGIYNYCDRWCERCPFQHRCRVFAEESRLSAEEKDINNDKFWHRLTKNMQKTLDMLHKMADELGIDLEGAEQEAVDGAVAEQNAAAKGADESWDFVEKSETRELCERIDRRTKRYSKQVDRFFDLNQDFFHSKQAELEQRLHMDLPVDEAALRGLQDAFQVIRWYQYFVASKAHRALSGFEFESEDDAEYWADPQNDSNGSAKVALLAIRRSMAAWETVRQMFTEKTDELLDLFVLLRKTENDLLAVFPGAMDFVRPGFDEPRRQPKKKHFDVAAHTHF